MSIFAPLQTMAAKSRPLGDSTHAGSLLLRKCACGKTSRDGECAECKSKKRLQAKLSIGASNDPLEQEADRIADQVLAAPSHSTASGTRPRIQRFAGQSSGQADTAPASVDSVLANPGSPLNPALQQDMEQRFGHDFSRVRVHSGSAAEQSTQEVNANAYTVGHNIVFGAGQFAPGTNEGRRLLAHELTHVVQQSADQASDQIGSTFKQAGTVIQRQPIPVQHYKAKIRSLENVSQEALKRTQQTEARLCTQPDNQYTKTNCPEAGILSPGTEVTITNRNTQGGWLFVETPPIKALGGQKYGWVLEAFVEPLSKGKTKTLPEGETKADKPRLSITYGPWTDDFFGTASSESWRVTYFNVHVPKGLDPENYVLVQWMKGKMMTPTGGFDTILMHHGKGDVDFKFDDWEIDSPDLDPVYASAGGRWPYTRTSDGFSSHDKPGHKSQTYLRGAHGYVQFKIGLYERGKVPTDIGKMPKGISPGAIDMKDWVFSICIPYQTKPYHPPFGACLRGVPPT